MALGYYYRGVRRRARVDQERGRVCVCSALCGAARLEPPAQTLFCQQRVMKNINGLTQTTVWPKPTTRAFSASLGRCTAAAAAALAPAPDIFHFYFGCRETTRGGCCHAAAAIKTFPLARNIKLLSGSYDYCTMSLHANAPHVVCELQIKDAFIFWSIITWKRKSYTQFKLKYISCKS